jgi:hypothetical protein
MRHSKKRLKEFAPAALVLLFAVSVIFGSCFLQSCSHSVEYQIQHDTDTLIRHDTISGPAFLRFISILNNTSASGIITLLLNSPQSKILFADATQQMGKQFTPVPHDSSFKLYASFFYGAGLQKTDSVTIPPTLKSYSMTTIAFFSTGDPANPVLFSVFADDSARRFLPPKDFCYIRLINGLPDYPQPNPSVNMHIDDTHAPAFFKDNVNYQEIKNYVLLPAGNHTIYVRSETDITQSYSLTQQFDAGGFYTLRLFGHHADGTDQLVIDME